MKYQASYSVSDGQINAIAEMCKSRRADCIKLDGNMIHLSCDTRDGEASGLVEEIEAFLKGEKACDNSYKAQTFDDGKAPLAMLPIAGIRAVAGVQAYGNSKYKSYDDYRKGMEVRRILSCALRHIYAYLDGETADPESKQPHLAHAACRILFALQNEADGTLIDDRFKQTKP